MAKKASDKLIELRNEAKKLGVKFHPMTGEKKLEKLIKEFKEFDAAEQDAQVAPETAPAKPEKVKETAAMRAVRMRQEETRLIRVRISCMNPNKKDWPGEILSVSNRVLGTIKKYIPFNAEDGWHIPKILLDHIQERKCQVFVKTKRNGKEIKVGKLVPEFSVQILPELTAEELKDLAEQQALRQSV